MARTSMLSFVDRCSKIRRQLSTLRNFWAITEHDLPSSGGAYLLVADHWFVYPCGKSPVFYIGQSKNLRTRLRDHLKFSLHVTDNCRSSKYPLYWPRYEYAGKFGSRYAYVQTHQGMTPRGLEEELLASFAQIYKAFPIANGSGSWNRVLKHFATK